MKIARTAIVLLLVLGLALPASGKMIKRTMRIAKIKGAAEILRANGEKQIAKAGMILREGDSIDTKKEAWVLLRQDMTQSATVKVNENARLAIRELEEDVENESQKTLLDLAVGKILIKVDKIQPERSKFEVKTPTSVVGVRGTEFEVEVEGLE